MLITFRGLRSIVCVTLVCHFFLSVSDAQKAESVVRGRVLDPSSAAIQKATVTAFHSATGASRSTATNHRGYYVLSSLPAGRYEISASATGFQRLRKTDLTLNLGEQAAIDFSLPIGTATEEITVTVDTASFESGTVAIGETISNNYIVNLPLNGRNFLELSLLMPGVSPSAQGSAGSARGRLSFQSNGLRESQNAYIYDGVYAVDPILNTFTLNPPVDAVQEFQVYTSGAEAPFGSHSGGQVAIIFKSGINKFHGSVYEFFRNDKMDARNFFEDPFSQQSKLRRNQFGLATSGPLRPNNTFFFVDYEKLFERRGITQTTNVPTTRERSGDFSQSLLPAPINPFTGQPFPNANLPFLHPVGAGIANLYPLPNRDIFGQNFVASPTQNLQSDKFDFRLDQVLHGNARLTGRYSLGNTALFEPYATGSTTLIPGFGNAVDERGQNLMIAATQTMGSRWVNEFRFGYNRSDNSTFHQNIGQSVNQTLGLPDFSSNQRDLGLSQINITGFSPLGDERNNPQQSAVDNYQLLNTVSYAHGSHLIRMGVERHWIHQDAFRDVLSRGMINFLGAFTQNPFADLLLGLPTYTGGAHSDNQQALRTTKTSLFLHDSWKLQNDFTLSFGLRYEYNVPAYDAFDRAYIYDAVTFSTVQVNTSGIPRAGYQSDRNNFAPRIGLAWAPKQAIVLRAGYGIYYNTAPLAPGQGIYFNEPLFNFHLFFPSAQTGPIYIDNPWPTNMQAPMPPSAFTYDRRLRSTYAQQWHLTLQGELSKEVIVEVGYHGTSGVNLLAGRDINQPSASPQFPNFRPVPSFQSIDQIEAASHSTYHSLQSQLKCRFRSGLTGMFSHTWSKSIDNASDFFPSAVDNNFPQDSHNRAAERARSNFDSRHRFTGSWVYELPFGEGHRLFNGLQKPLKILTSGWMLNGILTLQTGQPFSVVLPGELDNSNTGVSFLGGAADRPNVIENPTLTAPDPSLWFAIDAFALPSFGSFGNSGRNILSGPSLQNFDLALLKENKLSETKILQVRLEFFNVFNTPNFRQPNAVFGTPGFGRVLASREGREIQLGLKLIF